VLWKHYNSGIQVENPIKGLFGTKESKTQE